MKKRDVKSLHIFSPATHTIGVGKKRGLLKKTAYVFSAILSGAANGLFGGGGGLLIVPCLTCFGKMDARRAHATAQAVILPLSAISVLVYSSKGVYDLSLAWKVGCGVVVGGVIGAVLLKRVPKTFLSLLFYAIMVYAGIRFLR